MLDAAWLARLEPERLFGLSGRVALVTGAAGGIGRWLTAGFAMAGAAVVATDRDGVGLQTLAAELAGQARPVTILEANLEDEAAPGALVADVLGRSGRLDVLVNNAGVNRRIPMLDVDLATLRHIWEVDYIRCYQLSQVAAGAMIPRGGGSIIQIGSLNNQVGLEDVSMLGPTKAALSQLAKAMTVEFAHLGVRTNALAPGFMDTPMNATHWDDPTRAPWIFDRVPMQRPGHPAELVGAALLLASPASSFISGQTLYVDGGFTAGSRWNVPPRSGEAAYRAWRQAGEPIAAFETAPDEDR